VGRWRGGRARGGRKRRVQEREWEKDESSVLTRVFTLLSFSFFLKKKNSARNDANDFGKPEAAQGRRAARGARPARPGLDGAQGGPAGAARGGARCRRQRRRCSGAQYRCCCRCRCCGCCRSYCPRHRRPDLPASRAHVGPCRCGKGENGQREGSSRKRSHEKLAFDVDAYFFPHFVLPLLSLLNCKERKKTLTSPPPPPTLSRSRTLPQPAETAPAAAAAPAPAPTAAAGVAGAAAPAAASDAVPAEDAAAVAARAAAELERRRARAARFGVPFVEEKVVVAAPAVAKEGKAAPAAPAVAAPPVPTPEEVAAELARRRARAERFGLPPPKEVLEAEEKARAEQRAKRFAEEGAGPPAKKAATDPVAAKE